MESKKQTSSNSIKLRNKVRKKVRKNRKNTKKTIVSRPKLQLKLKLGCELVFWENPEVGWRPEMEQKENATWQKVDQGRYYQKDLPSNSEEGSD